MENELIKNYFEAKQAIYDHVGFVEDWVICPLDDCTEMYWDIEGTKVKYAESQEDFRTEDGLYYEDELYTQRFYKKHVYEGKDFTMVFCDPHVDGAQWFKLFDNSKKMS